MYGLGKQARPSRRRILHGLKFILLTVIGVFFAATYVTFALLRFRDQNKADWADDLTTDNSVLLKPSTAESDHIPLYYSLTVLVLSHHAHIEQRMAIRRSWGSIIQRTQPPYFSVLFVLGVCTDMHSMRDLALDEAQQFDDVLQLKLTEDDTTRKLLTAYRYLYRHVGTDFVLRTWDNVYVNVPVLWNWLQRTNYVRKHGVLLGHKLVGLRAQSSRIKLSALEADVIETYPPHLSEIGYMFSGDILVLFAVKCPEKVPLFAVENVYFTGFCRTLVQNSVVKHVPLLLLHHDEFLLNYDHGQGDVCTVRRAMLVYNLTSNELDQLWASSQRKHFSVIC